jgi:hypothetical protein
MPNIGYEVGTGLNLILEEQMKAELATRVHKQVPKLRNKSNNA